MVWGEGSVVKGVDLFVEGESCLLKLVSLAPASSLVVLNVRWRKVDPFGAGRFRPGVLEEEF